MKKTAIARKGIIKFEKLVHNREYLLTTSLIFSPFSCSNSGGMSFRKEFILDKKNTNDKERDVDCIIVHIQTRVNTNYK